MVYTHEEQHPTVHTQGLRVRTSPVPAKDSFSASVKSTNYLLNALNVYEAEQAGCDQVSSAHATAWIVSFSACEQLAQF